MRDDKHSDIDPIAPEEARAILHAAVREKLGPNWNDPESGWLQVSGHDYMMRLTRGSRNVDFYVDLLGQVSIEESTGNAIQDVGRLRAWMFLGGSLLVALALARLAGFL